MLRKHILKGQDPTLAAQPVEKDIAAIASVMVSSEAENHPIDNAFDHQRGPGGSRWVAEAPGDQTLIVAFDTRQTLRKVCLEVEEQDVSRGQEVQLAISYDDGQTYREILRQEYNFSPDGATFEREEWAVNADGVTHVRLWIRPDKGGRPCRASVTSLVLQ